MLCGICQLLYITFHTVSISVSGTCCVSNKFMKKGIMYKMLLNLIYETSNYHYLQILYIFKPLQPSYFIELIPSFAIWFIFLETLMAALVWL